jgi:peroxiredoxin
MLMLIALPWIAVAFGCWIGYQLIRQNGRILLHLTSLEQQLLELKRLPVQAASAPPVEPSMPAGLEVGSEAPPFTLPDLSGSQHSLSEWGARRLLLIFFNPGCGFCRQMAPDIAGLPVDDKSKPMPLLVSTGEPDETRKLVEEHGIKCPVLMQKAMEVASQYRVSGTPIGYLIDEQGRIASEMAAGAPPLLSLLDEPQPVLGNTETVTPHNEFKTRDLSRSKIKRDGLAAGTEAPNFHLPLLDGGEVSLDDFIGHKTLLIFSDPGCGPCQQLSAKLKDLWSPESEVRILMISRGDKEANIAKAREHGLRFPIALQKQWEISKLYAMFATPVGYLIDENGRTTTEVATGTDAILGLLSSAATPQEKEVAGAA